MDDGLKDANENTLCQGCGSSLQSESESLPGYVPASGRTRTQVLCRRCFRIRNYGEFTRISVTADDYRREVSRILDHPGIVLYVLDVFDLNGSLVEGLSRYVLQSEVVVVVNKVDLLPREVNVDALADWIHSTVEKTGVKVHDVKFVSATSGEGVIELVQTLVHQSQVQQRGIAEEENQSQAPIYVVGMANVGKSTLLNRMLMQFGHTDIFTTSRLPGTTLGNVAFDLTLSSGETTLHFVDTPGLLQNSRLIDVLCADCLKVAVPAKRLRPRVFQLNAGQTLWLGNFARFDFLSGPHQAVVCYVSNDLTIHRTKLDRAAEIGEHHADDILQVPCSTCRSTLGLLQPFILTTRPEHAKKGTTTLALPKRGSDLVIPGLGWITLFGDAFEGTLYTPKLIQPVVRRRLVGDLSRVTTE